MELWLIWLIAAIFFVVVEMVTVGMVSLWFAAGSLVAMVMALAGVDLVWQLVAMVVVSVVLLALFWSLREKMGILPSQKQPTNADRLLGKEGKVILAIDPAENIGQVQVNGQIWSARTDHDKIIEVGKTVVVKELRGVKLVVEEV